MKKPFHIRFSVFMISEEQAFVNNQFVRMGVVCLSSGFFGSMTG
ncbi:hypothetical protein [Ruminococcus sp.]|nr:hypothetical protein [Ruminococcus sp.]